VSRILAQYNQKEVTMDTKAMIESELRRSWECLEIEAKAIKATMNRVLSIASEKRTINSIGELQSTHTINALCGKIAALQNLLRDIEKNK
jgi:hypothetical protein